MTDAHRALIRRRGMQLHEALYLLEQGALIARRNGLDDDSAFRAGLALAFAVMGFSKEETVEAVERVMADVATQPADAGNRQSTDTN